MPNTLTSTLEFCFKGQTHSLVTVLDLDQLLMQSSEFPALYALIAKQHGFDLYSYEYEVMQEEEVVFSEPHGLAQRYEGEEGFDIQALARDWPDLHIVHRLQPMISKTLGIADLTQQPKLQQALLQAYKLGRDHV